MGFFNENMTCFFCVFRTIAVRFVLNCVLLSRILGLLQFLVSFFNSWRWTKLTTLQYSCWFEMAYCWKAKFFGLFYSIRKTNLQSFSWFLAEFYFNRGLQRLYTGTCIILQKTINGFLCLLIVFLKSKTYQLILKDVIKLNSNLR